MQAHKRGSNALADRPTSIYADVYPDPVTRGRALTIFMTVSNTHCIQPHKIEEDETHNISEPVSCNHTCRLLVMMFTSSKGHRREFTLPSICVENIRGRLLSFVGLSLVMCMIGHSVSWRF